MGLTDKLNAHLKA